MPYMAVSECGFFLFSKTKRGIEAQIYRHRKTFKRKHYDEKVQRVLISWWEYESAIEAIRTNTKAFFDGCRNKPLQSS